MKRSESKAQAVWNIFEQIARVPRPSGKEQQMAEWIRRFAAERAFSARSDSVGNIIVAVPPTPDRASRPSLILQGHMDMVCQKQSDSTHDFLKDPIRLVEQDGWLCADGTTLGADNGIGMALALALATEPNLSHPALELLFTVDEETGLTGATALAPGFLRGKRMLNLDSEDDSFTVGCAGGEQTQIDFSFKTGTPANRVPCRLTVSGLRGGHSGVNVHEQRANALKLLTRSIAALMDSQDIQIIEMSGGSAHNAIPRDAQAIVLIHPGKVNRATEILSNLQTLFRNEYNTIDPAIQLDLVSVNEPCKTALSPASTRTLIDLLLGLPSGVHRVSQEFTGVVETSNNLAVINTIADQKLISIVSSQRSLKESCLDEMTACVTSVARLAGAAITTLGRYPGWDPDPSSALLAECSRVYEQLRGRKPAILVIHAGLECGIIGKHFPGMDMVSLGPNIENAHSPHERLDIASVDNTWTLLKTLLTIL
jgi:dipeptidase D